CSSFAGTNVSF
nr:immunoglobulin light chain junction region [Macaca mulatta]